MSMIPENHRQITIYYNSNSSLGQKCYAAAESSGAKVLGIDLTNTNVTGTDWVELADMLDVKVMDLIDQAHPVFEDIYGEEKIDLDGNDAVKLLEKHPEILVFPIVLRGNRAIQAKNPSDINKLVDPDTGSVPQP